MATETSRDDRVLAATRWTAGVVAIVLAVAGVILYFFPTETALLWAWEINPPTTALAVGGGYLAGASFFVRAWREPRWHAVGLAFLAATVLSTLLLAATILHWDKFSHGHVSFWAWLVVYVVAPWLLPLLWLRNRRRDPGDEVDTVEVPRRLRLAAGVAGLVQTGAALALFAFPRLVMGWWPWQLSPLTTRTISAFLAFVGVVWVAFLWERRWGALRMHVESATLGLVLVGIGVLRAPADLTGPLWATVLVVGLLAASVVAALLLQLVMHRSAGSGTRRPRFSP